MAPRVLDLVGPHGYIHGWQFVGGGVSSGGLGAPHMGITAGQKYAVSHPKLGAGVATVTKANRDGSFTATIRHKLGTVVDRVQKATHTGFYAPPDVRKRKYDIRAGMSAGEMYARRSGMFSNDSPSRVLDFVGPKGYIHGWIYVGTSGAAQLHGKPVTGTTASGSRIQGLYDHLNHEVISPFGKRQKVTQVQEARGQDWRTALAAYDRRVAKGTMKFGPSGYAQGNAGQKAADRDLINFVKQHVHALSNAESTAGRKAAYKSGHALPPPSPGAPPGYPITDASHWDKARQAVGRVKDPKRRAALARLLRKTAPQFGRTQQLSESWAAPGGKNMSNSLDFADGPTAYRRMPDETVRCTNCGKYNDDDAKYCDQCGEMLTPAAFNDGDDANYGGSGPEALRTLATGTAKSAGFSPQRLQVSAGNPPGASLSNVYDFAGRPAVTGPGDIIVSRSAAGRAVIRHRQGGGLIGELWNDGQWFSSLGAQEGGKKLSPHVHQRGALSELLGTYNASVRSGRSPEPTGTPLQPPPAQTPLMQRFGIPAVRAFATPADGSSDGPRVTSSSASSGDVAGLSPKGVTIYKKLKDKGMPPARALAFARRAQNFGSK